MNINNNYKLLLKEKTILSFDDKMRIEEQFLLQERGIPSFAFNLLDSGAALLISSFGTKIVGAVKGILSKYVGKQFRLPVSAFHKNVNYSKQHGPTSMGDNDDIEQLVKIYDEIERLIIKQMQNIKGRGSLFAYLNKVNTSDTYLGLKKNSLDSKKLLNTGTGNIKTSGNLFDVINQKNPEKLTQILKGVITGEDQEAINNKISNIVKKKENIKSKGEALDLSRQILAKYDINTYKNLELGGKKYTDLKQYILSLMDLAATNDRELKALSKQIKAEFGGEKVWRFSADEERVKTAHKSNFSWIESRTISKYLVPRLKKILKLRDDAIRNMKLGDNFKTRDEKIKDRKSGKKAEPKKETSTKKNKSQFFIDGKEIVGDVVGELMSVSPVDGSAKKFMAELKKGYVSIDFIFSSLRVEGSSISHSGKEDDSDEDMTTKEGVFVNAKIALRDVLMFFQKLLNNTKINLIKIIKVAKNVNGATNSNGEPIKKSKPSGKGPGRPSKQDQFKNDALNFKPGGFQGSDITKFK